MIRWIFSILSIMVSYEPIYAAEPALGDHERLAIAEAFVSDLHPVYARIIHSACHVWVDDGGATWGDSIRLNTFSHCLRSAGSFRSLWDVRIGNEESTKSRALNALGLIQKLCSSPTEEITIYSAVTKLKCFEMSSRAVLRGDLAETLITGTKGIGYAPSIWGIDNSLDNKQVTEINRVILGWRHAILVQDSSYAIGFLKP